MPETIATPAAAPAAPAAAPSTPAPAAPSTPVTPTPAAPVAPVTPAAPATPEPAIPATPGAPSSATPAAKPEPKREDFQSERDWIAAHFDWQDEQAANAPPAEVVIPGETAPEAGLDLQPDKTAEEIAAEADQPVVPADAPEALTPEAVSALEAKVPELKQFFEEHPEVKGAFYETSRKLAKAQPIADLFPNLEAASFASETANSTVEIRTGFLRAADDPSQIGTAFDRFTDEFREYDDKGQPKVDAAGNPVYGKDYELLLEHATNSRIDGSIDVAKEKIASGKLSAQAQQGYETYVEALEYMKSFDASSELDLDRPDTSEMTPEQKAYFDKRDGELKQREEEAGLRTRNQASEAAKQARQAHEVKVGTTVGQNFGKRLDELIKAKLDSGVHIPAYVLQAVDPVSKISYFAKAIYDNFMESTVGRYDRAAKKFVGGVAKTRSDFARLESLPPGDDSARQRVEFFNKLQEEHLPRIFAAELKKIQGSDKNDRTARDKGAEAARAAVQPEPRAGSAPRPVALNVDAMYEKARAEVTKENEGKHLSDADRQELINRKVGRMMF